MGCCHAFLFVAMSIALAVMAITAVHRKPHHTFLPDNSFKNNLSINASKALRLRGNYNMVATVLQLSPELFLSSPESTIFAIQDKAFFNLSVQPWLLKQLLLYHTSPFNLPIKRLLKIPNGTCLPTLLHQKRILITNSDLENPQIEINNVQISDPDLFLEGPISIHGVSGPFSALQLQGNDQDWNFIQSPLCNSNQSVKLNVSEAQNTVEWPRIVHLLSSNGFVSFAIGLHSVLDRILQDYANLSSVTIFAPPDLLSVSSPSAMLHEIVRFHILPRRFSYRDLASLPNNALLRTLVPYKDLQITASVNSSGILSINGVKVTAPDFFPSKNFTIHGISRAFNWQLLSRTSR